MTLRTLMVNLDLEQPNDRLLSLVGGLADRFDASVVGIAACQLTQGTYSDGFVPHDMIEAARNAAENRLYAVEAQFRQAMGKRFVSLDWRACVTYGGPEDFVAHQARCADLIITGRSSRTGLGVNLGNLVMDSGRPILFIPPDVTSLTFKHVIVAWKDTREARRAVVAALPVIKLASRVSVIEIAEPQDIPHAQQRVMDVVQWLARHSVQAEAIAGPTAHAETKTFSEYVESHHGDLIVAGAYGHSRLREWVLGGFTRHLLGDLGICALFEH